jgi:hypothetical protein
LFWHNPLKYHITKINTWFLYTESGISSNMKCFSIFRSIISFKYCPLKKSEIL